MITDIEKAFVHFKDVADIYKGYFDYYDGDQPLRYSAERLKEAFEQIDYIFTPSGFQKLLPDPVSKFFSCSCPAVLIIGIGLLGIFAAFRADQGKKFAFPVLFVLSAYILCSGVTIADEYEFARHSMVIILMMKASAWPLIIMLLEGLADRKSGIQS